MSGHDKNALNVLRRASQAENPTAVSLALAVGQAIAILQMGIDPEGVPPAGTPERVPLNTNATFAEALKRWRREAGLTQEFVSRFIHMEPRTVMRWESGNSAPARWPTVRSLLCELSPSHAHLLPERVRT